MTDSHTRHLPDPEPRWPATIALVAAGLLPMALPRSLTMVPPWGLAFAVAGLIGGAVAARHAGRRELNEWLAYSALVVLTVALLYSLFQLVSALPRHTESA